MNTCQITKGKPRTKYAKKLSLVGKKKNPADVVSISDISVIRIPNGRIMCALFHFFLWQRPPNKPKKVPTNTCAIRRGKGDMPMGFNIPKIKKVRIPTSVPVRSPNNIPDRKTVGETNSRLGIYANK